MDLIAVLHVRTERNMQTEFMKIVHVSQLHYMDS